MTTKRITLLAVVLAILALLGAGQAAADEYSTRDYVGEAICVYNSDGRQECFWVNSVPGEVWHQYERSPGGDWSGAESLGGVATSGIDVAQNADGRLEIFVREVGADLAHKWLTAAVSAKPSNRGSILANRLGSWCAGWYFGGIVVLLDEGRQLGHGPMGSRGSCYPGSGAAVAIATSIATAVAVLPVRWTNHLRERTADIMLP